MASEGTRPSRGVVCLGNDAVLDWTIALCASVHRHDPELPLTLVPFDDSIERTSAVLRHYGYDLYEGPMLDRMDRLGERYFPGEGTIKPHIMRKFCAWDVYDEFLYLDCDIVVLRSLLPYLEAFGADPARFVHFATDMVQVYRPGPLRERMVAEHDSVGFNSGVFMGRRGDLTTATIEARAVEAELLRGEFVDNLEQTLINYCVDRDGLAKADANDLVENLAVAGALMRLTGKGDDLTLDDRRVPYSGRKVSLVHWAGYGSGPLMPYRDAFLRYRLALSGPATRRRYLVEAWLDQFATLTPRNVYWSIRILPYRLRGWLSARGLAAWHGSQG